MRILLLFMIVVSSSTSIAQVKLIWTDNFTEDISFTQNWHYTEGIYVNRHGQLSCDGLCPTEIDAMKDGEGRLIEDSLSAFYALVDTTHIYSTINSSTNAPEYAGGSYLETETTCTSNGNSLHLKTHFGISTHSILNLTITNPTLRNEDFSAEINYISIRNVPPENFKVIDGSLEISRPDFDTNLLKAKFDLIFEGKSFDGEPLTWSGIICSPITSK